LSRVDGRAAAAAATGTDQRSSTKDEMLLRGTPFNRRMTSALPLPLLEPDICPSPLTSAPPKTAMADICSFC